MLLNTIWLSSLKVVRWQRTEILLSALHHHALRTQPFSRNTRKRLTCACRIRDRRALPGRWSFSISIRLCISSDLRGVHRVKGPSSAWPTRRRNIVASVLAFKIRSRVLRVQISPSGTGTILLCAGRVLVGHRQRIGRRGPSSLRTMTAIIWRAMRVGEDVHEGYSLWGVVFALSTQYPYHNGDDSKQDK